MKDQKKYDIFISYRTSDTAEKAELLSTLLEHKYPNQISYDKDNLEGLWDVELARRIDGCTDVIVLIGEKSFQLSKAVLRRKTEPPDDVAVPFLNGLSEI